MINILSNLSLESIIPMSSCFSSWFIFMYEPITSAILPGSSKSSTPTVKSEDESPESLIYSSKLVLLIL